MWVCAYVGWQYEKYDMGELKLAGMGGSVVIGK